MLTISEIREARGLLGWSSARIARRSRVNFAIVLKVLNDNNRNSILSTDLWAIRTAFERAGVEFTPDGPRLRQERG